MADTKISGYASLTGATLAAGDLLVGVDISDLTMAASGTTKKITAGELLIGLAAISAGLTLGTLTLAAGTLTASQPTLSATQTWNNAAVTFDLLNANVANTASSADSTMLNLKLGGTSLLSFKPAGGGLLAGAPSLQVGAGATTQRGWIFGTISSSLSGMWITGVTISSSNYVLANNNATTFLQAPTSVQININGVDKGFLNASNFRLDSAHIFGWSGTTASTALTTGFSQEAAGVVQINSGTANTYADLKLRNTINTALTATSAAAPTLASAATIAPTKAISFVSGTVSIDTITAPSPISAGGGQITLIPTGLWSTTTAGNIALATTAVVNKALILTYDTTTAKWYPSY